MTNTTHTATFIHDTISDFWHLDSEVMNLQFQDMKAARRAFPNSRLIFKPRNGDTLELLDVVKLVRPGAERWSFKRTSRHGMTEVEHRVIY